MPRFADIRWNLHIVPGMAKQSNQQGIRRVVIKV